MRSLEESELGQQDFEQIREMAYRFCGLNLLPGKEELVKARLGKKLRELGLSTYRQYCERVTADKTGEIRAGMIDALTTHHTQFFREPQHFALLRALLRESRSSTEWRVWSAACSTGEEPYSIAITALQELAGTGTASQLPGGGAGEGKAALPAAWTQPRWKLEILATDVSVHAVETGRQGRYQTERFRGLPMIELKPYLLRGEGFAAGWYLLRPEVRERIQFRCANLLALPEGLGRFKVIFCRNVMIYFDQRTQGKVVQNLAAHLEPGGHLLIGHAESLNALEHGLEYVRPAVYRRPLDGTPRSSRSRFAGGAPGEQRV